MSDSLDKSHMKLKAYLYKIGFRPKPPSIFYSPSLALRYGLEKMSGIEAKLDAGITKAWKELENIMCICGHKLYEHDEKGYNCQVKDCTCPLFRTQRR